VDNLVDDCGSLFPRFEKQPYFVSLIKKWSSQKRLSSQSLTDETPNQAEYRETTREMRCRIVAGVYKSWRRGDPSLKSDSLSMGLGYTARRMATAA